MTTEIEEWARADQVERMFGLRLSYLRKLAGDGKIQMKLLRESGAHKGVRLFHVGSIRKFIESAKDE